MVIWMQVMKTLKIKKSFMMTIDNEEDDHHEVESNIEVDGDNDNNMLCSQNFISLLHLTPKRENFATV